MKMQTSIARSSEISGVLWNFSIILENMKLHDNLRTFLCYENKFLLRNRAQKCRTNQARCEKRHNPQQ